MPRLVMFTYDLQSKFEYQNHKNQIYSLWPFIYSISCIFHSDAKDEMERENRNILPQETQTAQLHPP